MQAVAFGNNDIGLVAWKYDKKISKCLGFAVSRIDLHSRIEEYLPAWVGFKKQSHLHKKFMTTREWPVQKFNWRDFTAKRGGLYRYKVVPMVGEVGNLHPYDDPLFTLITNPVHLSPNCGDILVYFNRGIVATQAVSRSLGKTKSGKPNYKELVDRIDQPSDPLRNRLSADMRPALFKLINRAKSEGGQCYCALYEFSDPELESAILGSSFVHIILSNTAENDKVNRSTRQALHESNNDVTDRMLGGNHIGHNKFVVYVDSNDKPQAVLTGSTNWTATGLCGQTNNAIIIESPKIANSYLDYWNRLRKEGNEQGLEFRNKNSANHKSVLDKGNTNVTLWFSPNTKQKNKPSKNPKIPFDMAEIFEIIRNAKQAILFLAFKPGKPSFIEEVRKAQSKNPNMFVRGAITDEKASEGVIEKIDLYHYSAAKPDHTIISPAAIEDEFSYWQQELLKTSPFAHAIIHDKIIVVDPFLPESCAIVTGSHNLGLKASYSNDENLVIIRNNLAIAEAYSTHVMDIYDHYRWRNLIKKKGKAAWDSLEEKDNWQNKYYKPNRFENNAVAFWLSAAKYK